WWVPDRMDPCARARGLMAAWLGWLRNETLSRKNYTSSGCPAGHRDAVVPWLARVLEPVPMTQHLITNVEIDLDGDRATVRALFHNPLQLPGMPGVSHCGGTYEHEVVRTPEGWRSRQLVETMLWSSNPVPPRSPPPTDETSIAD